MFKRHGDDGPGHELVWRASREQIGEHGLLLGCGQCFVEIFHNALSDAGARGRWDGRHRRHDGRLGEGVGGGLGAARGGGEEARGEGEHGGLEKRRRVNKDKQESLLQAWLVSYSRPNKIANAFCVQCPRPRPLCSLRSVLVSLGASQLPLTCLVRARTDCTRHTHDILPCTRLGSHRALCPD